MAWRDNLSALRDELAEVRAQRLQRADDEEARLIADRDQLVRMADSLKVSDLLLEMNSTLLQNRGDIQRANSWNIDIDLNDDEDDVDPSDEEPDEDAVTTVLSWEEAGDREIAVEVVSDPEGISLQVNGVEIRPEREALEQALVEAFRDELEL